jgi:hypothetical protein
MKMDSNKFILQNRKSNFACRYHCACCPATIITLTILYQYHRSLQMGKWSNESKKKFEPLRKYVATATNKTAIIWIWR